MKVDSLTASHRCPIAARLSARFVFFPRGDLIPVARATGFIRETFHSLTFTDVDRHQLSTADGHHVTIIPV